MMSACLACRADAILKLLYAFGASPYQMRDLQLFRDADAEVLAPLLAPCPVMQVAAGATVSDTRHARLYIVLRGALAVASDSRSGVSEGTVSKILPGESVGEESVLDEAANLAPITALQDSELLLIEAELVWQLIDASNGVARNLLRLLSFRIRAANAQLRRRQKVGEFYRQLSMVDGLTNLNNRAWLNEFLPNLVAAASATQAPLSLLMIDLDHFKRFNDTHGHVLGDQALRTAARQLSIALRPSDFAVRYGGEEMLVVLPDTNLEVASTVAQRLCDRMQQAVVFDDMRLPLPHITASFGVASLVPGQDEQTLIAQADAALYRAKEAGRNRVAVHAPSPAG
jgi:diguanylate cyclase (GGDEF)-like protein